MDPKVQNCPWESQAVRSPPLGVLHILHTTLVEFWALRLGALPGLG